MTTLNHNEFGNVDERIWQAIEIVEDLIDSYDNEDGQTPPQIFENNLDDLMDIKDHLEMVMETITAIEERMNWI